MKRLLIIIREYCKKIRIIHFKELVSPKGLHKICPILRSPHTHTVQRPG